MTNDLTLALEITARAAEVSLRHFEGQVAIELKRDESPVTIADRETEAAIREALARQFPDDGIFGEEFGTEGLERDRVWVIDPIDGTRSFIAGVPLFGMLMALMQGGSPEIGIIRLPRWGRSMRRHAGRVRH